MPISQDRIDSTDGRYYFLPWGSEILKLPSVSTILEIINRPGLMTWYGRVGLEEAERIRDYTASIGSDVHSLIEKIMLGNKLTNEEWAPLDEKVKNGVRGFIKWLNTTGFKPRQAELTVYSVKHGYAGTLDSMGLIKNRATLADWKVTGALWPEVKLQLAAYYMAYLEMYPNRKISDIRAVRFNRDTGDFEQEIIPQEEIAPAFDVFLSFKKGWDYLRRGIYNGGE